MKKSNSIAAFFGIDRSHRAAAVASLLTVAVLALAILLNALTSLLPPSVAKLNLTQKSTFEVSSEAIGWVESNLEEDVTLYWVCKGGMTSAESDLYNFLLRYAAISPHLSLQVVDPASVGADFIGRFGGTWPADRSLIVESARRYRIVDISELYYYYFYDGTDAIALTAAEYESFIATVLDPASGYSESDIATLLTFFTAYFDGNSRLTNAINFVTAEHLLKLYTLTGSGASALDESLLELLDAACLSVGTTLTVANLPNDCDVLLINAPTTDLSTEEAAALSTYLAGGGKLLLTTFYAKTDLPNLAAVLDNYGLGFGSKDSFVLENDVNYVMSDSSNTYPMLFMAHLDATHPLGEGFGNDFVVCYPHAITLTETDGVTLTPWLTTSKQGQLALYDSAEKKWTYEKEKKAHTVGAIAECGDTQIVWLASPDSLTAEVNAYSSGSANFALTRALLERLGGTESLSLAPAALPTPTLTVTAGQFALWGIILVLVIPALTLTVGIAVWLKRRSR